MKRRRSSTKDPASPCRYQGFRPSPGWQVPTIDAGNTDEAARLFGECVVARQPVVLRGLLRDRAEWPCAHRWSGAYLASKLHGVQVQIEERSSEQCPQPPRILLLADWTVQGELRRGLEGAGGLRVVLGAGWHARAARH